MTEKLLRDAVLTAVGGALLYAYVNEVMRVGMETLTEILRLTQITR